MKSIIKNNQTKRVEFNARESTDERWGRKLTGNFWKIKIFFGRRWTSCKTTHLGRKRGWKQRVVSWKLKGYCTEKMGREFWKTAEVFHLLYTLFWQAKPWHACREIKFNKYYPCTKRMNATLPFQTPVWWVSQISPTHMLQPHSPAPLLLLPSQHQTVSSQSQYLHRSPVKAQGTISVTAKAYYQQEDSY